MNVFTIGDLHLSFAAPKPMDLFGDHWTNHAARIAADWRGRVTNDDLVLIPGDISWALKADKAKVDLEWIDQLPGCKVMIRGNHDYWWTTPKRTRALLPASISIIHNDALVLGGIVLAGTRGWLCPGDEAMQPEDQKIYRREVGRLELSLKAAAQQDPDARRIVMIHYMPFNGAHESSGFSELLERYQASLCLYGHLHGEALQFAFEGERNGVHYRCVSADHLGFRLAGPLLYGNGGIQAG